MKIIQINGFRGLIMAAFIGVCLFAGFVVFPGFIAMHYWNKYLVNLAMFPELNLFQGVLLWGITAVSYCIISKNRFDVSFRNSSALSDADLESIIKSAKKSSQVRMMDKFVSTLEKTDVAKDDLLKVSKDERESSLVSSPISLNNKQKSSEKAEEETISNIK